jgi:hypothetical protein
MQVQRQRNRKRSQRRAIHCPLHGCYLDSVSRKYHLYADQVEQLEQRGFARRQATLAITHRRTIPLQGEWLEEFWCEQCQKTEWYHVRRFEADVTHRAAVYQVSPVPPELWQQVTGAIDARGNPSVSEFTLSQSRMAGMHGKRQFAFIGNT